jgi:hypothetical protein
MRFKTADTLDAPAAKQQQQKESPMGLLASSYDQSKYFRAEDVQQDKTLKIKGVTEEKVGQGADQADKLIVWFENSKKGLVLNRTNNRTIRRAYGDDTANWVGKLIVVFPTQADFRGRLVAAVRVRIPLKDNPRITTGKPAPEPEPEILEPEEVGEPIFDDEIGF